MKLSKLKCDRCHNEYEEHKDHDQIQLKFKEKLTDGYMYANWDYDGDTIDLCKFCRSAFKQWWNAT